MLGNQWYKKEMPLKGLFGMGVGGSGPGETPPGITYVGAHAATTNGSYSILHITGGGAMTVSGGPHDVDFIMVARGGSNNHWYKGGGGGGGGFMYGTGLPMTDGTYPVSFGTHEYVWNNFTCNRGGGCGRPYGTRPANFGGPPTLAPVPHGNPQAKNGIPGGSGGGGSTRPTWGVAGNGTQPGVSNPNSPNCSTFSQQGRPGRNQGAGGGAKSNGSNTTGGQGWPLAFDPTIPNDGGPWGAGANVPNYNTNSYPMESGGRATQGNAPGLGSGGGLPGADRTTNLGTPGSLSIKYLTP